MLEIQNPAPLRSAFLKIGWAPLVTLIGVILVAVLGIVLAINNSNIDDPNDFLSSLKFIIVLSCFIGLVGYYLSYKGFAEVHCQFGMSPAGNAVSTLKIIFLIYIIFGVILLIAAILIPSSVESYGRMADKMTADKAGATMGIVFTIFQLIQSIFSIVALFLIKSKTQELADNTNIESLQGAATGARWAVYIFFMALAMIVINALAESLAVEGILSLAILGFAIYALVRWVGGWLGAASEVMRHPVEIETYVQNNQE